MLSVIDKASCYSKKDWENRVACKSSDNDFVRVGNNTLRMDLETADRERKEEKQNELFKDIPRNTVNYVNQFDVKPERKLALAKYVLTLPRKTISETAIDASFYKEPSNPPEVF